MTGNIPRKHFYMIRHGQTEANAARIMAGVMDTPLTELGRQQAKAVHQVVKRLKAKPTAIIHSQLSRARDTASIINEVLDLPVYEDAGFGEINAGEWEGVSYEIANPLFTGWVDVPGGEKTEDFFARVKQSKINALTVHADPVLIVCHGGVMRAIGEIWGISTPGRFENAHLYEFMPHERTHKFPWDVYHYRYCEDEKRLTREKSPLYDAIEALEDILPDSDTKICSASKIA